jgi:hypothetical protein
MRRPRVVRCACALAFVGAVALAACSGGSDRDAVAGEPSGASSTKGSASNAAVGGPVPTNPDGTPIVQPATGLACTLLNQHEVEQALDMSIAGVQGTEAAATCSWEPQLTVPGLDVSLTDHPNTAEAQYSQQSSPPTVPDDDEGASAANGTVTDTQLGDKAFFLDKQSVVELYVMKGGKLMMLRLHTNDYPAFSTGAHDTLAVLASLALGRY